MKKHYSKIYEGVRDGKVVKLKRCRCGLEGVVKEGADSDFRVYRRSNGKLECGPLCRKCDKKRQKAYHERHKNDAGYKESRYETRKRWLEREENRERARQATQAWRERKRKQDPDYFNEYARMRRTLVLELEGKEVRRSSTVIDGTQPRIELEPFHVWMEKYVAASPDYSLEELATELHMSTRSITNVLDRRNKRVSLDMVEKALVHAVRPVHINGELIITLDDLYGEGQVERSLAA